MLRYQVAPLALCAYRAWRYISSHKMVPELRVLLFHEISKVDELTFSKIVRFAVDNYQVLTPAQAESWFQKDDLIPEYDQKPPLLFTFDDGFVSNFTLARPILERYGVTGIFFICPGLVSLPEDEQRFAVHKYVKNGNNSPTPSTIEPLMTWQQIENLARDGHTIGNHGLMHRRLSDLQGATLIEEIEDSRTGLHDKLGVSPAWYAYAFGDIRSISADAINQIKVHHKFCRSGVRGANEKGGSALTILSEHIDLTAPLSFQHLELEGGLDWCYRYKRRKFLEMI